MDQNGINSANLGAFSWITTSMFLIFMSDIALEGQVNYYKSTLA